MQNVVRFAAFEVDSTTGELRKHGIRLKLADQPFRVLMALVERPGELVTRDELKQRIWPDDAFGDFQQGLNRTVSKLREVLGDSASRPRFIETLPGRGYRFICPLEQARVQIPAPPGRLRLRRVIFMGGAAVACLLLAASAVWLFAPPPAPPLRWRKLTNDNLIKMQPVLSDGMRVYFLAAYAGELSLMQAPLDGGQTSKLPVTLPGPHAVLQDISADGQELLITASGVVDPRTHPMPLWALRVADGTARRIGEIEAASAAYEPNAGRIAYSAGPGLWIAEASGLSPRRLVDAKGKLLDSVHWSPDGRRIRFAELDGVSGKSSAWELRTGGSGLREIFPEWSVNHAPMGWTPDGRVGMFSGEGTVWADPEPRIALRTARTPAPLLTDAPEFLGMARLRNPAFFHVIGIDRLAELQRFDSQKQRWIPFLEGLSADGAEYSRDGQRVAYITYPQHNLWVRQADGSKPIQLTSLPFTALNPRWSPDGRRIAFNAQEAPDKPIRLYTVDSNGGAIRPVPGTEQRSQGYATWSPDGRELLYGVFATNTVDQVYIRIVDLNSGKVTKLEGSDGLFAPRYSPDGNTIAANERLPGAGLNVYHAREKRWEPGQGLKLYHVREKRWETVPVEGASWPTWAPDSRSVLFGTGSGIERFRLATGRVEHAVESADDPAAGYAHCVGVTPKGEPIRTVNRDSRQVYELRWEQR